MGKNSLNDELIRVITTDGYINCAACVTTNLTEEARSRHNLYPIATAALGRLMTGALMLASMLKGREKLVLSIKATGPLQGLSAEARPDGTVRGFVTNPHVDIPSREGKLAVGPAVGGGFLYVTRFLEEKGRPYQGVVEIVSGEISEDITYYLAKSEQTPAAVSLGVFVETDNSVGASGGVMVQSLPEATDELLAKLEKNVKNLSGISRQIKKGVTPEEMISIALEGFQYKKISSQPLSYRCRCNIEMVQNALHLLPDNDLSEMLEKGENSISCQFCSKNYKVPLESIKLILESKNPSK